MLYSWYGRALLCEDAFGTVSLRGRRPNVFIYDNSEPFGAFK